MRTLSRIGRGVALLTLAGLIAGCAILGDFGPSGEPGLPPLADGPIPPEFTAFVESQWPGAAFIEGIGINVLISAEPGFPAAGAAYHDTAVWLQRAHQEK